MSEKDEVPLIWGDVVEDEVEPFASDDPDFVVSQGVSDAVDKYFDAMADEDDEDE